MAPARFEVFDSQEGFCFRLFGLDGEPMLWGGPIVEAHICLSVVARVKNLSESRTAYQERDDGHGYGFVVADTHGTLATSEAYETAFERDMAMSAVRLIAISAPIIVRRSSPP